MSIHHEHAQDILDTHLHKLINASSAAYAKMGGLAVPLTGSFGKARITSAEIAGRNIQQDLVIGHLRDAILAATDVLIAIQASAQEPVTA